VAEAVAALNIQLDNLCQFLPQDRVVAFAQMTPCELLLETEKAFGSRQLHDQHTELIAEKQGMKDLEAAVASHASGLERLRGVNAGLERDVERFKARSELLAKADAMRGKLPWLMYERAREEHEKSRDKLAAGRKNVRFCGRRVLACAACSALTRACASARAAQGEGGCAEGVLSAAQVRAALPHTLAHAPGRSQAHAHAHASR
jgi:hypothetical protein